MVNESEVVDHGIVSLNLRYWDNLVHQMDKIVDEICPMDPAPDVVADSSVDMDMLDHILNLKLK